MNHHPPPALPIARRGFTILEVTIVVAIIAILTALATVGLRALAAKHKRDSTRLTLINFRSMLGEPTLLQRWQALDSSYGNSALAAPGNVGEDNPGVRQTTADAGHDVMLIVQSYPPNRNAITKLPPRQLMQLAAVGTKPAVPLALDEFGNPIFYVPPPGLSVNFEGVGPSVVQSPDGKGFFASAGPDGDFSKGDDNIYSFE